MKKQKVQYMDGPEIQDLEDDLPERWQSDEEDSPDVQADDRSSGYPDVSFPMSPVPMDSTYGYPASGFQLGYQSPPRRRNEAGHSSHIYSPAMPFSAMIPGGTTPGRRITIEGVTGHQKFSVQLTDPFQVDVGLFFNPVIHWGIDSETVIMNIRFYGCWGREIREKNDFPFKANAGFTVDILFQEDQYEIEVNNEHTYRFLHRLHPVDRFQTLVIEGDVRVKHVQFR